MNLASIHDIARLAARSIVRAALPSLLVLVSLTLACKPLAAIQGTQAKMNFGPRSSLYDGPFPSEELRAPSRQFGLPLFPNPGGIDLINRAITLLEESANGFGTSSGIFFQFDGPLRTSTLPSLDASVLASSNVFLLGIDPASPDYLVQVPVQVSFTIDAGPFGAPNLLSILPLQGFPLRPNTAYAAVALRAIGDASGVPLGAPLSLVQLAHLVQPQGMPDAAFAVYVEAVEALAARHTQMNQLAALTAFTTGDPISQVPLVRDDALMHPLPLPTTPLTLQQTYPDFCLYKSTVQMPDYQVGTPPYATSGGRWTFTSAGAPIYQRSETANLFVTIPRRAQPASGWPAVLYIRAGGNGPVPMVDRGPASVVGGPNAPGEGPAKNFAQIGYAGIQVDGPLGGSRNPNGADEEFLVFNFQNPDALRDNIRESAMETSLVARAIEQLTLNASDCDGATPGTQSFDIHHLAQFSHSTGSTIGPLSAAIEPRIGAMIMSGAGGSYMNNVLYKKMPIDVLPLAEVLIGYTSSGRKLVAADPVLSLIQWASEPADPQVYARLIQREPLPGVTPKQVLMFQGIVDHYIMLPMANSLSLPLGIDLAGPSLDQTVAEIATLPHIRSLLSLNGRSQIALPASLNVTRNGKSVTGVLVQHYADDIDDGHETVFQTQQPMHQYRCYLQSWAQTGVPTVPDANNETLASDSCP